MSTALLFDIEGTIGAIDFVAGTLFPYSLARLETFVAAHGAEPRVAAILAETRAERPDDDPVAALLDWHRRDVKARPLKTLQGLIWEEGFRSGAFRAHLYDDAVAALRAWHAAGIPLYIYSSGSIQAQKLYLEFSAFGDLRPLFSGHYDTGIGAKTEADSYRRIAADIGRPPGAIRFFSDNPREVRAALEAGLRAIQILRPGTEADPALPTAADFTAGAATAAGSPG